jgi:uncharacterized protein (DUF433 family)
MGHGLRVRPGRPLPNCWYNPGVDSLIKIDREIMSGTPCFAGTRVPVQTLFDYLSHGHPLDDFLEDFPTVSREHALAVIKLAGQKVTAAGSAA